jgi:hypothetical protein
VAEVGGPVHADEVVFREDNDGCYAKVSELGTKIIIEGEELVRTVEIARAIVKNPVAVEEFGDGVARALVPDFIKPAYDELLVALERGERLAGARHGAPRGGNIAGVYTRSYRGVSGHWPKSSGRANNRGIENPDSKLKIREGKPHKSKRVR